MNFLKGKSLVIETQVGKKFDKISKGGQEIMVRTFVNLVKGTLGSDGLAKIVKDALQKTTLNCILDRKRGQERGNGQTVNADSIF